MSRKRKERSDQRRSETRESMASMDPRREADYIIKRAQQCDARLVCMGPLIFFSTESGDAWMLDSEDHYAIRLAIGGEPQPARFVETETQFGIDWDRDFRIEGDLFISADKNGRVITIAGYPTREISRTIERMGLG